MIAMHLDGEELLDLANTATRIAGEYEGEDAGRVLGAFAEAGLLSAGAAESAGGLGLPITFDTAIIDAASRRTMQDAVPDALLAARHCPDERLIPSIIDGTVMVAVAATSDLVAAVTDGVVSLSGTIGAVPFAPLARFVLAPVRVDRGEALALVDLNAAGVARPPAEGFDDCLPIAHVVADDVVLGAASLGTEAQLKAFREDYLLFTARWLLKQAETCLDLTVEFVSNRRQFGRALASFQSVRFTLARITDELRGLALLAAPSAEPHDRLLAYVYASSVVPQAIEKCMHLHGGMGYTEEVSLHLYLRRARARIFAGEGLTTRRAIAECVIASTPVPACR